MKPRSLTAEPDPPPPPPPAEKPKVMLHTRVQDGICIKKGEEIRIDAFISGSPYPKVTWLRNHEDVTKEPTKKVVPLVRKKKSKAAVGSSQSPETCSTVCYISLLLRPLPTLNPCSRPAGS